MLVATNASKKTAGMQRLIFLCALLLSFVLMYLGSQLLFLDSDSISQNVYFLFAVGLFTASIIVVAFEDLARKIQISAALMTLSIYSGLRGFEVIASTWLATLMGCACWVAAALLLYTMHPDYSPKQKKQ